MVARKTVVSQFDPYKLEGMHNVPWTDWPWRKGFIMAALIPLVLPAVLLIVFILVALFLVQLSLFAFFVARRLLYGIPIPSPPVVDDPPEPREKSN